MTVGKPAENKTIAMAAGERTRGPDAGMAGGAQTRMVCCITWRALACLVMTCLAIGLGACSGPVAPVVPPSPVVPLPAAEYAAAACTGSARVYRLVANASRVQVSVGKAGALSALGHEHMVVVRKLRGLARVGPTGGRADLVFPLAGLAVGPLAHSDAPVDAEQRAGTREHMLESLAARRYPVVRLAVTRPDASAPRVRVRLTLHGQTRTLRLPLAASVDAQAMTVDGAFDIHQSSFGVEPYSILMGALRVSDRLRIRYHLVLRRWQPGCE